MRHVLGIFLFLIFVGGVADASSRVVTCFERSQNWRVESFLPAPLEGLETVESSEEKNEIVWLVKQLRMESDGQSEIDEEVQEIDTLHIPRGECVLLRKWTKSKIPAEVRVRMPIGEEELKLICERQLESHPFDASYRKTEDFRQVCVVDQGAPAVAPHSTDSYLKTGHVGGIR